MLIRKALEGCVKEMEKVVHSVNAEAGYRAAHVDFLAALQQAQAALGREGEG